MTLRGSTIAAGALLALLVVSNAGTANAVKLHGVNFFSNCRFSHFGNDDPIVHPGDPGASHPHTFFGNSSTNADSTLMSLRAAGTTCSVQADKAAYWVPTLFVNGRPVRPAKAQAYYVLRGYEQMHPFPAGLKIVAGDSHAVHAQRRSVTYWACGAGGVRIRISSAVPTCGVVRAQPRGFFKQCKTCPTVRLSTRTLKTYLELHVDFPDCWDGKHLDSPDHHSHMAYSVNYVCPRSHPVKVPLIRLNIHYPVTGGADVFLASGGQFSGHADFFNAWDERFLTRLVDTCFHDHPCDPRKPLGN